MAKLSKLGLDPKDFGLYVNNLGAAFALMDSKDDIQLLFKDMFTHTEYKMFAKRLEIARRLLEAQKYDQISEELHVTQGTIAQVSNILAQKGNGYRKAHDKLNRLDRSRQRKIIKKQDYLERRTRPKLTGETVLFDAVSVGARAIQKSIRNRIKRNSSK